MSITESLYQLILGPLELIFDVTYALGYRITINPGLSIIFLSLVINLLVFPFYRRADEMQEEERQIAAKLKPGIDQIKKVFKGDERVMILQTYYRQNNYKPYYSLRGSLSLLLEIPFFITAYHYLYDLQLLNSASFGPIMDLGGPDAIINIGGLTINILPILMTLINIISGAIYTKDMPLKSKIQLYGMALIFLAFLYNSPSGLVFYWTLNNLFSLLKNIFYIIPNPKKTLAIICSVVGILMIVGFNVFMPWHGIRRKIIIGMVGLLMQIPTVIMLVPDGKIKQLSYRESVSSRQIYYISSVMIILLIGILIPTTVINASPAEFIDAGGIDCLKHSILYSVLTATGLFGIWSMIFYRLSSEKSRLYISVTLSIAAFVTIIDYMFFGKSYGNLSSYLQYDNMPQASINEMVINVLVVMGVIIGVLLLWKKIEALRILCIAGSVVIACMSIINLSSISKSTRIIMSTQANNQTRDPYFSLDKQGKNVVVIMLDRAISAFVPFILNEKPILQEQFQGFTYYPNTLSYGAFTNVGTPPLYGGYEYTPQRINERTEESLKEKQNEALKVMPVVFLENGFDVTVCDPPYANYMWSSDLSIFDDYPGIHRYITEGYYKVYSTNSELQIGERISRNLFMYGLFRAFPVAFQSEVYDKGRYNTAITGTDGDVFNYVADSPDTSYGYKNAYLVRDVVLQKMSEMTKITDTGQNTFLTISNTATHEPMLLQEPMFEPKLEVDNTVYESEHSIRYSIDGHELKLMTTEQKEHYQVDMSALLRIGVWLDYLRDNDLYDNTRIIIVSDHGRNIGLSDQFITNLQSGTDYPYYRDVMFYNALFMVKDFDSKEFSIDNSFMTNADTPSLAFEGLITDPINPFSGNQINSDSKFDPAQYIIYSPSDIEKNNGNVFQINNIMILRNQNIFDYNNWTFED
ncbi:membrane protein insertase, YidC/Oxa1 family, C-terminal domain-containing protein [Lachnospiraceae bacterium XBB2008]|nr:membrane protein insertase, YidC/Oxa1 family, C-terminal domain-containing protein [Lachnospiraceae bacterium XBB2008]